MKAALNSLLLEVAQAYDISEIKQTCLNEGYEWHYSLVTTNMKPRAPLIIGFNWGASNAEKYEPQHSIEGSDLSRQDIGSLSRIAPYCEKYFGLDFLSKASQSNYVFFRSQMENQIKSTDIDLCEPIFEKLIVTLEPSLILCFSSKLRDYLIKNKKLASSESKNISYKRGKLVIAYEAIKATLNSGIEIKFLPHPNYPMKGVARAEAWEFCCSQ